MFGAVPTANGTNKKQHHLVALLGGLSSLFVAAFRKVEHTELCSGMIVDAADPETQAATNRWMEKRRMSLPDK